MLGRRIFLTGGTGYLGSRLIPLLLMRGHEVTAMARPGSEARLPPGARIVAGDALDPESLKESLADSETWIQLIGTPHPAPRTAQWAVSRERAPLRAISTAKSGRRGNSGRWISAPWPPPFPP